MKCIYSKLSNSVLLIVILLCGSCEKQPTDYRSFLKDQEVVYPAAASGVETGPGNQRVLLKWARNPDPSIQKYIIYWNGGADSTVLKATADQSADTVKTYINGLDESIYNFLIYSFDDEGNRSIPVAIENIKVYGEKYRGNLLNRSTSGVEYLDNKLTIIWNAPDTINVQTEVKYTDLSGQAKTIFLPADSSTLVIPDWKLPTKIY